MSSPPAPLIEALSREFALRCALNGDIAWADSRGAQLGLGAGANFTAAVAPAFEARARELFERAKSAEVRGFELSVLVHGKPLSLRINARPFEGGLLLVASVVPTEVSEAMAQVTEIHRTTERQARELERLNAELEDSNQGMRTLYQELDDKSDSLRRAAEVKGRVVANVSHEFRTPLNSISGLARLLLSRTDGPLSAEQEKQVNFILKSADELSLMVNDLLDLSKLESGKTQLRPSKFTVTELFAAMRGMVRALQLKPNVELHFEGGDGLPPLETDEGKVSQILRNLISNAIKFTEKGEIRVTASIDAENRISFAVKDTGIGIDPADHPRIFEEFTQLENEVQRRVKGTGLGLSLSRRLSEFLGGTLSLKSELGKGATFTLTIPLVHPEVAQMNVLAQRSEQLDPFKSPVMVVEDDRQTMFLYEKYLQGSGYQVIPARTIEDARAALQRVTPAAIVLDVILEGETTWAFLSEIKKDPRTRDIPVLVCTVTDREQKARALGADEFCLKPMDQGWLLKKLRGLARHGPVERVLVIDDDEVSRYLVRRLLADTNYQVVEAGDGHDGIRAARDQQPQVILLDFVLPDMSAFDVLDDLKTHPMTRAIPVIIHTSRELDDTERRRLSGEAAAILQKQALSREVALGRIRDALVKAGVKPESR